MSARLDAIRDAIEDQGPRTKGAEQGRASQHSDATPQVGDVLKTAQSPGTDLTQFRQQTWFLFGGSAVAAATYTYLWQSSSAAPLDLGASWFALAGFIAAAAAIALLLVMATSDWLRAGRHHHLVALTAAGVVGTVTVLPLAVFLIVAIVVGVVGMAAMLLMLGIIFHALSDL